MLANHKSIPNSVYSPTGANSAQHRCCSKRIEIRSLAVGVAFVHQFDKSHYTARPLANSLIGDREAPEKRLPLLPGKEQ